jgi:hypothetical protein
MLSVEGIEHDRNALRPPSCEIPFRKWETEMNRRLVFSMALIAVLLGFWLVMSRPMCRDGLAASLDARLGWTCVADRR